MAALVAAVAQARADAAVAHVEQRATAAAKEAAAAHQMATGAPLVASAAAWMAAGADLVTTEAAQTPIVGVQTRSDAALTPVELMTADFLPINAVALCMTAGDAQLAPIATADFPVALAERKESAAEIRPFAEQKESVCVQAVAAAAVAAKLTTVAAQPAKLATVVARVGTDP